MMKFQWGLLFCLAFCCYSCSFSTSTILIKRIPKTDVRKFEKQTDLIVRGDGKYVCVRKYLCDEKCKVTLKVCKVRKVKVVVYQLVNGLSVPFVVFARKRFCTMDDWVLWKYRYYYKPYYSGLSLELEKNIWIYNE